ncbi:MAG: glycosyltransferase family 39 protein [Acidobacteria bacterium]|nr:glycosyltransferase family 39 protein [Acidobacteriota bacterium]MBI3422663.1 glycosyltransferase family 39 protein [Acidobacteriota bacterium]
MKRALPFILCAVHLVLLILLARQHPFGTYATETDFYHFFAPDAERLAAGQFPVNTYQGPGYPAALALLGKLTGLGGALFTVGKWLSVVCAVLCGWLVFRLFAQVCGFWVGVGAQLLTVASGEFPQFSISATTDVFFLALCLATLVVFTNEKLARRWRIGGAAVLTGLSYLTRYNGLFLLAACLLGIVVFDLFGLTWRARVRQVALFAGLFVLVALPWFYYNAKHHGAPLYNTNYLNIATEFYPELVKGEVNQDATRALEARFHSFGDVLRYDPLKLFKRYPVNLWESVRNLGGTSLMPVALAWAALGGLLLLLALERRNKAAQVLLSAGLLYLLLMALNHWETRYYFFVLALCAGLAVYLVARLFELARARGWLTQPAFALLPVALVAALVVVTVRGSRKEVRDFLDSHPSEVTAVQAYLQSTGACTAQAHKRIVARKPHLAYLCRGEWIFFPQVKSPEELRAWLAQNPVDYLLISEREMKERKGLKPLGDPAKAPAWLQPVWSQRKPVAVLYQPVAAALTQE